MIALRLRRHSLAHNTRRNEAAKRKPDTASEFGDELDLSLAFFREEAGERFGNARLLLCPQKQTTVSVLDACAGARARTLRYLRDLPSDVETTRQRAAMGRSSRRTAGIS